jgi:hypothetical protein
MTFFLGAVHELVALRSVLIDCYFHAGVAVRLSFEYIINTAYEKVFSK